MVVAEPDDPVRRLPGPLLAWCVDRFGAAPARVLFSRGNLSVVRGLRLADGRDLVVKIRPAEARLAGCTAAQRTLVAAGFPAPAPLAGPEPLGAQAISAERLVRGGRMLQDPEVAAGRFAVVLARLVRLAPDPSAIPSLDPPPPWAHWDHHESGPWPPPRSGTTELRNGGGPAELDGIAARAGAILRDDDGRPVVGHVDFQSQNIRWRGFRVHCVHDWDSLAVHSEAAIAGLASAVFITPGSASAAATIRGSERFLAAYAEARGRPWTTGEQRITWAAAAWVLAYNARVECVEGRPGPGAGLAGAAARRLART